MITGNDPGTLGAIKVETSGAVSTQGSGAEMHKNFLPLDNITFRP